jgi:hypothetical protein
MVKLTGWNSGDHGNHLPLIRDPYGKKVGARGLEPPNLTDVNRAL